jgi:hypothetical protein
MQLRTASENCSSWQAAFELRLSSVLRAAALLFQGAIRLLARYVYSDASS